MIETDLAARIPKRATRGSAGYDIYVIDDVVIEPGKYIDIDTGVAFTDKECITMMDYIYQEENKEGKKSVLIPLHWVGLVLPRSSLGFKYGLRFANTVCVIDQDYRDTIRLNVTVDNTLNLVKGDRIAQIVFVPWLIYGGEIVPEDLRGGGIGSTGN